MAREVEHAYALRRSSSRTVWKRLGSVTAVKVGHVEHGVQVFNIVASTLPHCPTPVIKPPGTVVPGGLMFCCGFFLSFFFCGTLRRYTSEMAGAIALKLSHMIGSVRP